MGIYIPSDTGRNLKTILSDASAKVGDLLGLTWLM